MSKHTPTPWHVVTEAEEVHLLETVAIHQCRRYVAKLVGPDQNVMSNAYFIIRAVNSHDALVAALADALAYMEAQSFRHKADSTWEPTLNQYRAALKLAKDG